MWRRLCIFQIIIIHAINLILALNNDDGKNDCFERIALGAMLPFERTFRNEDLNSLKVCQEICVKEGERCQTIAFGVHVRGNGTCQLSSEKIDTSMLRPAGTIFDPDFDLYARKLNCFEIIPDSNTIPTPGFFDERNIGSNIPSTSSPQSSQSSSFSPTGTVADNSPSTSGLPQSTSKTNGGGSTQFTPPQRTDRYPTTQDTDRHRFNDFNQRPSYGTTYDMRRPTTIYPTYDQNRDRLDFYPLYKYPMLYEQDFPSTNNHASYPGIYAQNVPTVDGRYKPNPSDPTGNQFTTSRPVYGLGYGHDFTYGTPINFEPSSKPNYNGGTFDSRSQYSPTTPSPYNENRMGTTRTPYRPDYDTGSHNYMPRPDYQTQEKPSQHGPSTNVIPLDNTQTADDQSKPSTQTGGNRRPVQRPTSTIPSYGTATGTGTGTSTGPGTGTGSGTGTGFDSNQSPHSPQYYPPEGNYHRIPGQSIETYFNPDDYLQTRWTIKPGIYGSSNDYGNRYPVDSIFRACFRRVLAGKRVSPHWVRRTLACERVEDCMQECGHEKRFTCEGFNYRLDPSGHGQGDCELIEIPLSQMDLYSSTHSRDSNLLRHPDYDYYERDRNAPNSCRQTSCIDCGVRPLSPPPPTYHRPYNHDHYIPPSSSGYDTGPATDTAIDKYRPSHPHIYESRPQSPEYHYDFSSHSYDNEYYKPSSYGSNIDRYDIVRPDDVYKPNQWEVQIPSSHGTSYGIRDDYYDRPDHFRPPYRPGPNYSPYRPPHREHDYHQDSYHLPPSSPTTPSYVYYERGHDRKKPSRFIPYLIGTGDWPAYGGNYGGSSYGKDSDYWGLRNENRRKDGPDFNYFELGGRHKYEYGEDNYIWNYPGSRYGFEIRYPHRERPDYGSQWTRRPGPDECSVKFGEGFRLHKAAVRHSYVAPTVTECEKLCYSEDKFVCHTYSYRYSTLGRENCQLCDRPANLLDYYVDIEPDRDYDIYSMADDMKSCKYPSSGSSTAVSNPRNDAQCFFRAIDATRFFKSIVRDSLTVRSVGECELECIKITKFTCRAFAFRYGQRSSSGIIDNCQLSDWPVRDMDKERHLIPDPSFDVFERASYGHGCEIQPIVDEKHQKLCYLGYGTPAKLLSTAIKKVISVPTEIECKNECIRYRETTSFKCLSFSFGSQVSTFNCELSDLDQSQLKLNIHYAHTPDRDYWLFAWNPFDWTCRDMVATIGGSRVNNNRRMDIFREPGEVTWRHFTVSGKQCRFGNGCDKNLVTGFYSCEIEGGEIGSWDYCCKADHPCGYSQGFDYPWCFVGDEYDQWRKCSDRYYPNTPGHHHSHHQHHHNDQNPNQNNTHQSNHNVIYSSKNKNKNEQYQTLPRPDGLENLNDFTAARLWPVTYLYSEGPPNSTELSNFVDCNKDIC